MDNFQHSENLDQLAPALSALQGKLPHVGKDSKSYGYNYADLASTLDVLKPLLVEFGFSISQFGSGNALVTMLLHKSGQYIKGSMELIEFEMKGTNAAQSRGAILSYFRRYSIQAIAGMAAEDSDASSHDKVGKTTSIPAAKLTVVAQGVKAETPAPAARGSFRRNPPVTTSNSEDL